MKIWMLTLATLLLAALVPACGSDTGGGATFACGDQTCSLDTEYCEALTGDLGPVTTSYTCQPLPAACGATPTCACLSGEACGGTCTEGTDGELLTSCVGA
jgi:hypothetical protein